MPLISETFANEFLQTADVAKCAGQRTPPMTIMLVSEEDLGNRDRMVISFVETNKRLPLNKTNALFLAEELGDDTDDWRGAKLVLGVEKTMFQGKRVPCIRVVSATVPSEEAVAAAAAAAAKDAATSAADIPF